MTRRSWCAAVSAPLGSALAQYADNKYDVPWAPTHDEISTEMLKLAGVKSTDIVYDLGCGDGRIVIQAARRFGARGVGIDIDPERIREANAAAAEARVTDRVRFLELDMYAAPIAEATVVTLYLFREANLRLRPKLRTELAPGARVVAHQFPVPGWTPEREVKLGKRARIMLWRVR